MGIGKLKKKPKKAAKPSLEERMRLFLEQYGRMLLGLLVAFMIVHDVFGTHGFLAMRRTENEIRKVKADLDKLSKENEALEQEVKDLKSDPKLIEKIARDDLGLARPGEVIIRIPPGQRLGVHPANVERNFKPLRSRRRAFLRSLGVSSSWCAREKAQAWREK